MHPRIKRLEQDLQANGLDPKDCKFKVSRCDFERRSRTGHVGMIEELELPFEKVRFDDDVFECTCKCGKTYGLKFDGKRWLVEEVKAD